MLELFNVRGPNITTVKSHLQVGQNWGGLYFVVSCIKTILRMVIVLDPQLPLQQGVVSVGREREKSKREREMRKETERGDL